jgi:ABC-type phosphate/phosphonate transport system substrate-binding protein
VLKVFFRQTDAGLVNRRGFDLMKELNPQVGEQLKVLAASPPLVPTVFCFRSDFKPAVKDHLLDEITKLHTTPAGQQMLTIFQSERIIERPVLKLESALALLARQQQLEAAPRSAKLAPPLAK